LRLNRRWAPQLYLEVVPITGSVEEPTVGGGGEAIEYAVKMQQFPQEAQLDNQLEAGQLEHDDMHDLAATIAAYHDTATVLEYTTDEDAVRHVRTPMLDNFPPLLSLADELQLGKLQRWTEERLNELEDALVQRRKNGLVRECHGDLHLSNLVRLPSGIVPYDCVEFGAELRNIDVVSDLSFLVMDLVVRGHQDLAYTLLNRYLECTGDYDGMSVFGLYFVYHCMIRAKIAAIRSSERDDEASRRADLDELGAHLDLACQWIDRPAPILVAMHGYSASGKTWLSSQLLALLPAIRVRSDIERKRLHGMQEFDSSDSEPGHGLYTERAGQRVYKHLVRVAGVLLQAGYIVILDATFLYRWSRELVKSLRDSQRVSLVWVDVSAEQDELLRRLEKRSVAANESSEANAEVLNYQFEHSDPLNAEEGSSCVTVATDRPVDAQQLIARVLALCD